MLRIRLKRKYKGIIMKSGFLYEFGYQAWEHDPKPLIILLYFFEGTHPNTGRQWKFFQAINLNYIPRKDRIRFADAWIQVLSRTQNPRFTWKLIQRRFPFLKNAVRRYFYTPGYYVTELKEIPYSQLESAIKSTWSKDFSKKLKISLFSKFKRAIKGLFGSHNEPRRR